MSTKRKSINIIFLSFFLISLTIIICAEFSLADEALTEETITPASFKLKAAIMEIHLDDDYLVIAEKKILLPSLAEGGTKIWKIDVKNSKGVAIPLSTLKQGDRVLVVGTESTTQGMKAEKITLFDAEKSTMPSSKQQPSKIYQENGVWKN